MNIKSSKELVKEANETIKIMSPKQVKSSYDKGEVTLIDIRDIRELERDGRIENSIPISCLLYTSPSPRDGLLSRMPSSA